MWMMIFFGIFLSFLFFPEKLIFLLDRTLSLIIAAPLIIFLVYNLSTAILLHIKARKLYQSEKKLIKSGIYGKYAHPTCTTLAVFSWIIFLLYPDVRIFVSDIWLSFVIISWIEIEKSAYMKKKREQEDYTP
jgi:hypothetical protein